MQVGTSLIMMGSWDFRFLGLVVTDDLLRLLYLPIKAVTTKSLKLCNNIITKFHVTNMTIYMCDIHEIKKHAQLKAIFPFTIEPANSCFLIHYIYTIYAIFVKLDDVRIKNKNVIWILSHIHQYAAQARLKVLSQKKEKDLMTFLCFVLFCVVFKVSLV